MVSPVSSMEYTAASSGEILWINARVILKTGVTGLLDY